MTTIIVDDEVHWDQPPVPPGFVPPTIRQSLAEGFDDEAEFFVCEGKPFVVWPMMDYALDWSAYPIREVHPFYPILNGKKITEIQFRTLVRTMHCI
jgi:hypothetical protein